MDGDTHADDVDCDNGNNVDASVGYVVVIAFQFRLLTMGCWIFFQTWWPYPILTLVLWRTGD